jgi:polyadenylate-binding protein 2
MQARLNKMEAEMASLRSMQAAAADGTSPEGSTSTPAAGATQGDEESMQTDEAAEIIDARSVYVGNVHQFLTSFTALELTCFVQVDYGASPEEIQSHFDKCGTINRVTILCDKFTGHPKG